MKKSIKTQLKAFMTIAIIFAMIGCFVACSAVDFNANFVVDGEVIKTISTSGAEIIVMPENPKNH